MGLISLHASPPSPPPDPPAVSRGWFLLSQTLTLLLIVWLKSSQTLHDPPPSPHSVQRSPTSEVACPLTVQSLHYFILQTHTGDFPGGPVVETLPR